MDAGKLFATVGLAHINHARCIKLVSSATDQLRRAESILNDLNGLLAAAVSDRIKQEILRVDLRYGQRRILADDLRVEFDHDERVTALTVRLEGTPSFPAPHDEMDGDDDISLHCVIKEVVEKALADMGIPYALSEAGFPPSYYLK